MYGLSNQASIAAVLSMLAACTAVPPETEYRLGSSSFRACQAVDVDPSGTEFSALCEEIVQRGLSVSNYQTTVEVVDIQNGKLSRKAILESFERPGFVPLRFIADIAYSNDGALLAVAMGRPVLLDAVTLAELEIGGVNEAFNSTSAVSFSPDGQLIAFGSGGGHQSGRAEITLFRLADLARIDKFSVASDRPISSIGFSPDSSSLAASTFHDGRGHVVLYDLGAKVVLSTINHDALVADLAFSRDGRHLLTLSTELKIFELISDHGAFSDSTLTQTITNAQPQLKNSNLVTPGLWQQDFGEVEALIVPRHPVPTMTLSPDGAFVAVSDAPNLVNIVDIVSLRMRCRLVASDGLHGSDKSSVAPWELLASERSEGNWEFPNDIAWTPDGQSIVVAHHGLHILGWRPTTAYGSAEIQAADHAVEVSRKIEEEVTQQFHRSFIDSGLFSEGHDLQVRYKILKLDPGNVALRALIGAGQASIQVAVEFLDRDGNVLSETIAEGKTVLGGLEDNNDSFVEQIQNPRYLAWRRAAEQAAEHAMRLYSGSLCNEDLD